MFSKHDYKKCPYYAELNCERKCKEIALELIKNQQAEIKVLKSDYTTTKQDYEHCKSVLEDKQKIVEKLNQKLINAYKLLEKVKTEAFKEFAVKLLVLIGSVELSNLDLRRHINNLTNELTERKED